MSDRTRRHGVQTVHGTGSFTWPEGIDDETQVDVVKLMLLVRHLTTTGHGELVVEATAHALRSGGFQVKEEG